MPRAPRGSAASGMSQAQHEAAELKAVAQKLEGSMGATAWGWVMPGVGPLCHGRPAVIPRGRVDG